MPNTQDPAEERFRQAVDLLSRGRVARARTLLSALLGESSRWGVWACQQLVGSYMSRGEGQQAELELSRCLPPDSPVWFYGRGLLLRRSGRLAEATSSFERASESLPRLWAAVAELGYVKCRTRSPGGNELLSRAEEAFRRQGDVWGESVCVTHRATHENFEFHVQRSLELFERARELKQTCGDAVGLVSVLFNSAVAFSVMSEYRRAIDQFEALLPLVLAAGDVAVEARIHYAIGLTALDLSEPEHARQRFRTALRLARRIDDELIVGESLANLGYAARLAGQPRLADRYYCEAYELLQRASPDNEVMAAANWALVLTSSNHADEALRLLGPLFERDPPLSVRARFQLYRETARAQLALDERESAVELLTQALSWTRRFQGSDALLEEILPAEALLGEALWLSGDWVRAGQLLTRASLKLEGVLERTSARTVRIGLLETHRRIYDVLLRLGLESSRVTTNWQLVAGLKARELRALSPRKGEHATRLRELDAELNQIASGPWSSSVGKRLAALKREYRSVIAKDLSRQTKAKKGNALSELRHLGSDVVVVEFHVQRETTYAFVGRRRELRVINLGLPEAKLRRLVRRFVAPLNRAARTDDPRAFSGELDHDLASKLYARLLSQAFTGDRFDPTKSQLIIIPDGPLHELPFEMLRPPEPLAGWLIETCAVSYLPALRFLRGAASQRLESNRLLALGWSPAQSTSINWNGRRTTLESLPGIDSELRSALSAFAGAGELIQAEHATTDAYLTQAPTADVIHLAAHALLDAEVPELAGLVLRAKQSNEPEVLTGDRLGGCRLQARLVSVVACDSASGPVRGREGTLGLARQFLAAGSAAVLASRWRVEDSVSRELSHRFYSALKTGLSPSQALAVAKRAFISDGSEERRDPFFWAPYTLVDCLPETNVSGRRE